MNSFAYEFGQHLVKSAIDELPPKPEDEKGYARRGIRASENVDPKKIETMLRNFEVNLGEKLPHMPILADKEEYWRNIARYFVPRTLRQVPRKAWRGLGLLASPLPMMAGAPSVFTYADLYASLPNDNFYSGGNNTVNISSMRPELLAHEIGHYMDYERRQADTGYKSILNSKKYKTNLPDRLASEVNATLWAQRALGDKWKGLNKQHLENALGTYLYGDDLLDTHDVKGKKWTESGLKKRLMGDDPEAAQKALIAAIKYEKRKEPKFGTYEWFEKKPNWDKTPTNQVKWRNKDTMKIPIIARILLEAERARIDARDAN